MNRQELAQRITDAARLQFSRSGGPGGQHVNTTSTRVTVRVRITDLGLDAAALRRVRAALAARLTGDGTLVVHAQDSPSQRRNREAALERATDLIDRARRPPKRRRPTRPSTAARTRRLESKRRRGSRKRDRRPPSPD